MNWKEEAQGMEALGSFSNTSVNHTDAVSTLWNGGPPDITPPGVHVKQIQIQASTTDSQGGVQQR